MLNHTNNMANLNSSYLEIIIGPMFSGKTSYLVDIYKKFSFLNIQTAVINHSFDNRYDNLFLSTHDKVQIPCIKTIQLMELWDNFNYTEDNINSIPRINDKLQIKNSNVILINEGQFFTDLEEFINILLKNNKIIYVCGLDGDFERKKFGQILDIIPLCDKVIKLNSLCSICKNGNEGIFSMRLTDEKEQIIIGSTNYISVCRKCYDEKNF